MLWLCIDLPALPLEALAAEVAALQRRSAASGAVPGAAPEAAPGAAAEIPPHESRNPLRHDAGDVPRIAPSAAPSAATTTGGIENTTPPPASAGSNASAAAPAMTPLDVPVAITERRAARPSLIAVDHYAAALGLSAGLPLATALARVPMLRTLPRNPAAEERASAAVACWAYRFGAPVTYAGGCIWVEIQRSRRLYRNWASFCAAVSAAESELPYTPRYGVAPTRSAAALLARAGCGLARPLARRADIGRVLQHWPIRSLVVHGDGEAIGGAHGLAVLEGAGLQTIGDWLGLPDEALARRLGPASLRARDRLLGRIAEPFQAYVPPSSYRQACEIPGGATRIETVLFGLRVLLQNFALYLRARDVAVRQVQLQLRSGARCLRRLDVGMLSATRDPARLLRIIREQLERQGLGLQAPSGAIKGRTRQRMQPPEADDTASFGTDHCSSDAFSIDNLILEAAEFVANDCVQGELFAGHGSAAGTGEDSFGELHERLRARLGAAAVRRLVCQADARPERAWRLREADVTASPSIASPPRPVWLLPQPLPMSAPRRHGQPERIEYGWWDGAPIVRDYYHAVDDAGRPLWVFRDASGQWFLHGFWQ